MSDSPDQIRADIERTREELGLDVDALADKVTPSKIMDRQMGKVRGAFTTVRERVMGSADDAGSALSDAGDRVTEVKDRAIAKTEGNPLAVGLMAFGAGLLIASLVPASSKEQQLAKTVKDQAQPLIDEVTDVTKEIGEHLKEPAQASVESVQESAQESMAVVKDEAQSAIGEVTDQAHQARENITGS